MDKVNSAAGTLDTFAAVHPQLADVDFRDQANLVDVPVYWSRAGTRREGARYLPSSSSMR